MAELNTMELEQTEAVTLTPAAAEKLQALLREKNLTAYGLRVFVAGGGCSGMQYGMAFDAQPRETDYVFETEGIRLFVDPVSMMYIAGSQIDYVDSLMAVSGLRTPMRSRPAAVDTPSAQVAAAPRPATPRIAGINGLPSLLHFRGSQCAVAAA